MAYFDDLSVENVKTQVNESETLVLSWNVLHQLVIISNLYGLYSLCKERKS